MRELISIVLHVESQKNKFMLDLQTEREIKAKFLIKNLFQVYKP